MPHRDPDVRAAYQRQRYAADPQRVRASKYMSRYGITIEQYDAMFAAQGGVCAICDKPPKNRRLDVDHDHSTGQVRGLLCAPCNRLVGFFENHEQATRDYLGHSRVGRSVS